MQMAEACAVVRLSSRQLVVFVMAWLAVLWFYGAQTASGPAWTVGQKRDRGMSNHAAYVLLATSPSSPAPPRSSIYDA